MTTRELDVLNVTTMRRFKLRGWTADGVTWRTWRGVFRADTRRCDGAEDLVWL